MRGSTRALQPAPRLCGFTLIELMIVVMLIAVVTAVAIPGLAGRIAGAKARKAARDFRCLCSFARSKAANEVKEYVLVLDNEKHVMFVCPKTDKQRRGAFLAWRALPVDVLVFSESGGSRDSEFHFRPDGTAKNDAKVSFRARSGVTIKVELDAATGKAIVVS